MLVSAVYKEAEHASGIHVNGVCLLLHAGVDVRAVQLCALRHRPSSRSREPHPGHRGKMVLSMDPT